MTKNSGSVNAMLNIKTLETFKTKKVSKTYLCALL